MGKAGDKPLPFRGGVGVGPVGDHSAILTSPTPSPSPEGEGSRQPDRIDTGPRYSETDAIRLNNMFRGRDTVEMLEVLLKENMLGDAAIVSSFGAESAVLLHLIASIDRTVPVLFLRNGQAFSRDAGLPRRVA